MRIELTFYILLCLCICVSNGAPTKEASAGTSNTRFKKYTPEEDKFIVKELSRLIEDTSSQYIWKRLTERHNDKWRTKTPGFVQERSTSSLRSRFWSVLIHNQPHVQVKVPETLKNKLKTAFNRTMEDSSSSTSTIPNRLIDFQETNEEQNAEEWADLMIQDPENDTYVVDEEGSRNAWFSTEEDNFIFDELVRLNDAYFHVHSRYVWNEITANCLRKWKDGTPGFIKERSAKNLYDRFRYFLTSKTLPDNVNVPDSLMQKLFSLRSDSKATVSRYTPEEDKFIIQELLKPSLTNLFGSSTLQSLRAEHDKKRAAKIQGFESARSVRSLSARIGLLKNTGQLPKEIEEKNLLERETASLIASTAGSGELPSVHQSQQTDAEHTHSTKAKGRKPVSRYTPEEDEFIIEQLMNPSLTNVFGSSTLESLRAEHDKKRVAKIPGFENARSARSLSARIGLMKNSGQLAIRLEEKRLERQRASLIVSGASSGEPSSTHARQLTAAETEQMVDELLYNTEYEVDFSHILPEEQ